jgi:BirA family biotin operon repressor/biotin-[acetyl-CoA-carboxylase] ligase
MSALTFLALRALADGRFHSGEAMARSFQRSRATLSEALKRAPEMGIELFSVPGKGYRVAEPIDFLDAAAISSELARHDKRLRLDVVDEIESTSTRVLQLAAAGATSGTCIAAEWQSTGRGRRGRAWISRLGGSLTFSMLWRFERGAGHLGGLSLAVGEAVARALSECGVPRVQVKWPNDVVVDLRKLAGILVETSGEIQGPSVAVIGVGVNHRLSERVLDRIDQPVTDVWQCAGSPPSRSDLLARMLVTLAFFARRLRPLGLFGLARCMARAARIPGPPRARHSRPRRALRRRSGRRRARRRPCRLHRRWAHHPPRLG